MYYIYDYLNCKHRNTHTKSRSINLHWAGQLMFHQYTGPNTTPRHPPPPCWSTGFQVCCDISTAEVKTKMVQENRHVTRFR